MKALITVTGGPDVPKNDLAELFAVSFLEAQQMSLMSLESIILVKEWDGELSSLPKGATNADVVVACILKKLN